MINVLDESECYELLTTTTVGRVGFVQDGRVQIYPVNYAVDGRELFLRTSPGGAVSALAEKSPAVTFEVDFHNDLTGFGWSVLLYGTLSKLAEADEPAALNRVSAWAGSERRLPLRFTIENISGRGVRRDRR